MVLKKFIIHEGSRQKELFSQEVVTSFCLKNKIQLPCSLEGMLMPDVYLYDRNDELIKVINMALEAQKRILTPPGKNELNYHLIILKTNS